MFVINLPTLRRALTPTMRHLPFIVAGVEQQNKKLPGSSEYAGYLVYRLLDIWLDNGVVTAFGIEAVKGLKMLRTVINEIPDSESSIRLLLGDLLTELENAEVNDPFYIAPRLLAYGIQLSREGEKAALARYVLEHLRDTLELQGAQHRDSPDNRSLLSFIYFQCGRVALRFGDDAEAQFNFARARELGGRWNGGALPIKARWGRC